MKIIETSQVVIFAEYCVKLHAIMKNNDGVTTIKYLERKIGLKNESKKTKTTGIKEAKSK